MPRRNQFQWIHTVSLERRMKVRFIERPHSDAKLKRFACELRRVIALLTFLDEYILLILLLLGETMFEKNWFESTTGKRVNVIYFNKSTPSNPVALLLPSKISYKMHEATFTVTIAWKLSTRHCPSFGLVFRTLHGRRIVCMSLT